MIDPAGTRYGHRYENLPTGAGTGIKIYTLTSGYLLYPTRTRSVVIPRDDSSPSGQDVELSPRKMLM
jgi:hypothetical protein